MKKLNLIYGYNINNSGENGIVDVTNNPKTFCFCSKEVADIIINAICPKLLWTSIKDKFPEMGKVIKIKTYKDCEFEARYSDLKNCFITYSGDTININEVKEWMII